MSENQPSRNVALCWNPYRYQSRLLARFIDAVKQLCRTSIGQHAIPQEAILRSDAAGLNAEPNTPNPKTSGEKAQRD